MRRAITPDFSGAYRRGAAAKLAAGYGRAPKLTIVYRCLGCGENAGTWPGRSSWIIGACRILQVINRDAHAAKCAIEARDRPTARVFTSEFV